MTGIAAGFGALYSVHLLPEPFCTGNCPPLWDEIRCTAPLPHRQPAGRHYGAWRAYIIYNAGIVQRYRDTFFHLSTLYIIITEGDYSRCAVRSCRIYILSSRTTSKPIVTG